MDTQKNAKDVEGKIGWEEYVKEFENSRLSMNTKSNRFGKRYWKDDYPILRCEEDNFAAKINFQGNFHFSKNILILIKIVKFICKLKTKNNQKELRKVDNFRSKMVIPSIFCLKLFKHHIYTNLYPFFTQQSLRNHFIVSENSLKGPTKIQKCYLMWKFSIKVKVINNTNSPLNWGKPIGYPVSC